MKIGNFNRQNKIVSTELTGCSPYSHSLLFISFAYYDIAKTVAGIMEN